MSAIDPSLLFHQQQQQQQQKQQKRAQGRTAVNGQTGNAVGSTSKDGDADDNDASESEMQMDENAASGSRLNGDSEMQQDEDLAGDELNDESEPLDLKDDAVLAAFLAKMDDYEPILPNPVTRYYLERAGFQSADDRVTKLLGLAAQKFVSDIATDAFAYARTRTMTGPGRAPGSGNASGQTGTKQRDRTRTTLTMEDLSAAMNEYGIDATRAPYYR